MKDRAEFYDYPPEDIRLEWCDWLRHHTIDPNDVAIPGFVEIDTDLYQIRYLTYDINEHGKRFVIPDGERASTSIHVHQLEARPSELPKTAQNTRH